MTAAELKLDYFKIYDVANLELNRAFQLKGQFDERLQKIRLVLLDFFANPVSKNGEPIYNKNAHLAWYRGPQPPEPTRFALVENQFGKIKIWIGNGGGLLVPTQKVEPGSVFPQGLDHYKVYRVLDWDQAPEAKLKLRDQFDSDEVKLIRPIFFAVPVLKRAGAKVFRIQNERAHLLIMAITPRSFQKRIRVRNQVHRSAAVQVVRSVMLAAPSLKHEWKAL
jgi:hypothetical protein